jgi:hypothetical protein
MATKKTTTPAKTSLPGLMGGVPTTTKKSTTTVKTTPKKQTKPVVDEDLANLEKINKQVKDALDAYNKSLEDSANNRFVASDGTVFSTAEARDAYQLQLSQNTFDKQQEDANRKDAFQLLKDTFSQYGLEELASTIEGYMKDDIGPNQATLLLKQTPAYLKRFAGNETRKKAGLNVLSEAEYLSLENSYSETLKAYGQAGYFGTDRASRQAKLAQAIGADISAVEFKDRISTVVDRVNNADPAVKSTLRSFYKITDEDLVGYFLDPKENLPRLKEKVTSAEIGTAASAQGLATSMASAEELAKYGVDLETAKQGYATIADVLPTTQKLSSIYKEEGTDYTQQTAEQEVFKGLASAQRARTRLSEKEIASFKGQAGLGQGALRKGSAGAF